MVGTDVTYELAEEDDLEEAVMLNCSLALILGSRNRTESSCCCMNFHLVSLRSDMMDCVGSSSGCVEEGVDW